MRITGGELGGRIFNAPAGLPVRPTTDYAKSALFNILANRFDFEELEILDLFAGIGGITFDFLSRGSKVTSVESNKKCVTFIQQTSSKLQLKNHKIITADVFKFLKGEHFSQYDIIFADPPFDMIETDTLPELIFNSGLLKDNGVVIIEHQSARILETPCTLVDIRVYGNCSFSFFKQQL